MLDVLIVELNDIDENFFVIDSENLYGIDTEYTDMQYSKIKF